MAPPSNPTRSTEEADALARIESHWAVRALAPSARERAFAIARRWARAAPSSGEGDEASVGAVSTAATAYDLAALEYLPALVRPPLPGAHANLAERAALRAGATRAYELYAALANADAISAERAAEPHVPYRLLHLAALAVVADRADDFTKWLDERGGYTAAREASEWDLQLLDRTTSLWLDLLSARRGADTLVSVRATIAAVREARGEGERGLGRRPEHEQAAVRFQIFALYHLVDAAAALTTYLASGEPADILSRLSRHFALARAAVVGDARRELPFAWLHGAAAVLATRRAEQLSLPGLAR